MIPHDDKTKTPMGVIKTDDLMSSAKTSAMSRFIAAIKASDASQASDAFTDFIELCNS